MSPKKPPAAQTPSTSTSMTTPQRASNNYASTKTPITSAKRPKTRSPVAANYSTPKTTSPVPMPMAPPPPPSAPSQSCPGEASDKNPRKDGHFISSLSPMHSARPVPKDSHHVPTGAVTAAKSDDSGLDGCESKLSIETELHASTAGEDEESGESPSSASWVGRKVDAIFSPVLNFLQGAASTGDDGDGGEGCTGQTDPPTANLEENSGIQSSTNDSNVEAGAASIAPAKSDPANCMSVPNTDNGHGKPKPETENRDDIPVMTNTESSGSHGADIDGDVAMADYYDRSDTLDTYECYEEKSNQRIPEDDSDAEEEFNPYLFIKCLPPYEHAIPPGWASRPKALPPIDFAIMSPIPPICLVLDLDETLVHCTVEPVTNADMVFPVEFNGTEYQVHVRCRPFLREFLEAVSCKFEVVIFTASQQVYADKLLDKIDPDGKFIHHRMFRDSCLPVEGNFLKDLTVLGRDLSKAVLVDNSPHAFGYQVDNGIPIESWFDDPNDKELLKLEIFLRSLHGVDDVRDVVRKAFHTHQLVLDA